MEPQDKYESSDYHSPHFVLDKVLKYHITNIPHTDLDVNKFYDFVENVLVPETTDMLNTLGLTNAVRILDNRVHNEYKDQTQRCKAPELKRLLDNCTLSISHIRVVGALACYDMYDLALKLVEKWRKQL